MSGVEQRAMNNQGEGAGGRGFGSETGDCQTGASSYSLVRALSDIYIFFLGTDREHEEEGRGEQLTHHQLLCEVLD